MQCALVGPLHGIDPLDGLQVGVLELFTLRPRLATGRARAGGRRLPNACLGTHAFM